MNADRLRAWLKKRPNGATSVQLVLELPTGVGTVIGCWDQSEVKAALEPASPHQDPAEAVLEVAQDYTNEEGTAQRFLIRWMANERPALTTPHACKPSGDAASRAAGELAAAVEPMQLVKQLLDANLRMVAQITQSVGTLASSFDAVLRAQNQQIQLQNERAEQLVLTRPDATDEEREAAIQRAGAWQALTAKIPDVVEAITAIAADKFLPNAQEGTRQ